MNLIALKIVKNSMTILKGQTILKFIAGCFCFFIKSAQNHMMHFEKEARFNTLLYSSFSTVNTGAYNCNVNIGYNHLIQGFVSPNQREHSSKPIHGAMR